MEPELTLLEKLFPYLIAAVVGLSLGFMLRQYIAEKDMAVEKAAHARDVGALNKTIADMDAAAADAEDKALKEHHAQEGKIATLDDQLTKEKAAHEADNRKYADALSAGTQRLRVAVRNCTPAGSGHDLPAASPAPGVDDGAPAEADLDPAVAGRVFRVAGDDQHEIDKLRALQTYVCAIHPELPACAAPQ